MGKVLFTYPHHYLVFIYSESMYQIVSLVIILITHESVVAAVTWLEAPPVVSAAVSVTDRHGNGSSLKQGKDHTSTFFG